MEEPSGWIVVFIVLLFVLMGIKTAARNRVIKSSLTAALTVLDNFTASQNVMGADGATGLAIDEGRSTVCLLRTAE